MNEEDESPDADIDYMDDGDSDVEERKFGRRKRRAPARTRGGVGGVAIRTSRGGDTGDKPYLCTSELGLLINK